MTLVHAGAKHVQGGQSIINKQRKGLASPVRQLKHSNRINKEEAISRVTIGKKQNKDQQGMKSARKSASQGYYDRPPGVPIISIDLGFGSFEPFRL
jgi:hypothetical protein